MENENSEILKDEDKALYFKGKYTIQEIRKLLYKGFSNNGCRRSYEKKSKVFQVNAPADEVYIVESGRLRTYKVTPDGKEVTFEIINTGDMLGLSELLVNCPRIRTAEAISDNTTLLVINKDRIFDLMFSDKEFWFALTWAASHHIMRFQRLVEDLTTLSVRGKVIQLLVKMSEERGRQVGACIVIDYPLTHAEIARMLGCARQTITLILNELRDKEIISWKQKTISIISWKDLNNQALEFN